ncbi:hypothetical protein F8M41_012844 [Gigaspora margarita]|uniref:Restriction endonuclease type IV Mrr domain-containing protein n=1 Tax=Gigaspora margarita TaxID=4874 RepID=A0A8H3WZ35_GIGMA|nr:hypothetical protein F8M41_012844 [Gigaspora margarita]
MGFRHEMYDSNLEVDIAEFLKSIGLEVIHCVRRGDGGVDIIYRIKGKKILIQYKNWYNNIGPETIRSLRGVMCTEEESVIGIVVVINFQVVPLRKPKSRQNTL